MTKVLKSATAVAAVMLAAGIGAADAQQAASTPVETVVITGSRIHVSPLSLAQPVIQIDADLIAKTGLTSTADLLQRLPISGGGLNTRFNNSGNFGNPPDGGGVGAGSAEVDLRYLGSRRVLVLVDGLRWIPGTSGSGVPGAVDLNSIPQGSIARIEVLQEGASSIYGSDAISGVVNIITKSSQEGMQASAQVGEFGQGDGRTQDYNASWGATEGRTRIVAGVGYFNQDLVSSNDRSTTRFSDPGVTSCIRPPGGGSSCSSGTPTARIIIHDPNTGNDLDMTLNHPLPPGVVPNYDAADPFGPNSDYHAFSDIDRFNYQPFNYVITPSERISAFANVTHDITDSMWLRVRASYVQRKSANQAAPLPLFVGPDAGNGNLLDQVVIDHTNPYNPFGFDLGPGTLSFIGRRMIEAGPRHYTQLVNTWDINATLGGDFSMHGNTWYWDVNAVWARDHADQTFTGNINAARVQQSLGPIAGCTGACVPFNIFGGVGSITPAMLNFIGFTQQDQSEQTLHDYTVNLTGDLFSLPAGKVGAAFGYERREDKGFFQPDALVVEGLTSDIPAQPTSGAISVDEFYAEFKVPVFSPNSFVGQFDISGSGRWFDYSTSGWDSTYKVGATWRPWADFLARGSWGQGFRAPTIGEAFGSISRFDQSILDPCNDILGLHGFPVKSSTVQTNCIAHGVPSDGSYVQINSQLPVVVGGNPSLQPETSESWNYGVVWEPASAKNAGWANGFSIEVDYTKIDLQGAIQAIDAGTLLGSCAETGDALSCATITRTGSGSISSINSVLINIGAIKTQAVDLDVVWNSPETSFGTFGARWYTTFLLKFRELVPSTSGFTELKREGTERGSPDQAYPRTKSTLAIDWDLDNFGATAIARYISGVRESQVSNKLGSVTYIDAQLRWTPPFDDSRFRIAFGVNNLFDKDPPGCFSCGLNNYDPNVWDPPGRFFYARLEYKE